MSGKRHHFIPQFLQRGFATQRKNKDFYTWVYKKGDLNPFNANIKNVGIEGYFYSEDKEPTLDDIITDAETEYALFVEELRNNDGTQDIDKLRAANLIAHLEGRTKNLRDSFRNAGTLMLSELTSYFQDPANCQKFVDKYVEEEANKVIDELLQNNKAIPKHLYPFYRPKFMDSLNAKRTELAEGVATAMRHVAENFPTHLEKAARSGHINALLKNPAPPIKASAFKKLEYKVVTTGDLSIPLGDSAVIFHIESDAAYKPYYEVDKKLLAVILPISSSQILVGSTKNYRLNIDDISEAVASCSLDYFISDQSHPTNEAMAKLISTKARILSSSEIEDIMSDLVANS